jgi:hypothetical protein
MNYEKIQFEREIIDVVHVRSSKLAEVLVLTLKK